MTRPVIDMRCTCEKCEARTQETYRLTATCTNCRTESIALIRKGDRRAQNTPCPACGVTWHWIFGDIVADEQDLDTVTVDVPIFETWPENAAVGDLVHTNGGLYVRYRNGWLLVEPPSAEVANGGSYVRGGEER